MPPKKAAAAKSGTSSHPSYRDMIKDAIINLKDRSGSSRQALKKYVQNNNPINVTSQAQFDAQFNRALRAGVEKGEFVQPKGPSGPVKLAKKEAGKPAAKPAKKAAASKTAGAKKEEKEKEKKPAAKKATTKATTKKAAAPKKAATSKTKANITKQRRAPATPAVVDHPKVLGQTKSGRVTKSTAPQQPKKATPKKKTTTKKATPKKSE